MWHFTFLWRGIRCWQGNFSFLRNKKLRLTLTLIPGRCISTNLHKQAHQISESNKPITNITELHTFDKVIIEVHAKMLHLISSAGIAPSSSLLNTLKHPGQGFRWNYKKSVRKVQKNTWMPLCSPAQCCHGYTHRTEHSKIPGKFCKESCFPFISFRFW